jgi:hypothetical protein
MIREHSNTRLGYDVPVLICGLISCIVLPFVIVFHGGELGTIAWLIYLIDLVFWGDIALNFRTSFRQRGLEVQNTKEISRRYRRGYLSVDVLANAPFELLLLPFLGGVEVLGLPAVGLVMVLRLLRVVRLSVILRRWSSLNLVNPGYFRLVRFLGLIGLIAHWIACGWFLSALAGGFAEGNWVTAVGLEEAAPTHQYARSLYWTVTTMTTVGYGDITPSLPAEYYFAIAAMLLGASLYAYIIGSVASLLSNLQAAKSEYWDRMEAVGEYLRYRGVPHELNTKVQDYYEYLWDRYKGLKEGALLEDLPDAMRLEVMLQLAKKVLDDVPLFRHCPRPLRDRLIMSLQIETYAPGTDICVEGEIGKEIFFVTHGQAEIRSNGEADPVGSFAPGDYFGYFSLILGERRTANVTAKGYCEILILSKSKYEEISIDFPELRDVMKEVSSGQSELAEDLVLRGIVL